MKDRYKDLIVKLCEITTEIDEQKIVVKNIIKHIIELDLLRDRINDERVRIEAQNDSREPASVKAFNDMQIARYVRNELKIQMKGIEQVIKDAR